MKFRVQGLSSFFLLVLSPEYGMNGNEGAHGKELKPVLCILSVPWEPSVDYGRAGAGCSEIQDLGFWVRGLLLSLRGPRLAL